MKYTIEKLNQLKGVRAQTKKDYLEYDGTSTVHGAFLKKIRKEARREHREYRSKYKEMVKLDKQIKKLEQEVSEHSTLIANQKKNIKISLDNIIVETNHDNKEDFFTSAILSYALVQPVRFEGVIPYIAQYESSSKLYKIHKACKRVVSSKLDELNIRLHEV